MLVKLLTKLYLALLIPSLTAHGQITRRSFFGKLKDNYIAGRLEASASKEEKRIIERKEAEKMRRRIVFERNVKKLSDGLAARLKRKSWGVWIIGGAVLVVWLCHRGSMGCDSKENME